MKAGVRAGRAKSRHDAESSAARTTGRSDEQYRAGRRPRLEIFEDTKTVSRLRRMDRATWRLSSAALDERALADPLRVGRQRERARPGEPGDEVDRARAARRLAEDPRQDRALALRIGPLRPRRRRRGGAARAHDLPPAGGREARLGRVGPAARLAHPALRVDALAARVRRLTSRSGAGGVAGAPAAVVVLTGAAWARSGERRRAGRERQRDRHG